MDETMSRHFVVSKVSKHAQQGYHNHITTMQKWPQICFTMKFAKGVSARILNSKILSTKLARKVLKANIFVFQNSIRLNFVQQHLGIWGIDKKSNDKPFLSPLKALDGFWP
jgi:hypothetical protein